MYGEDDYNLGMEVGLPAQHTVGMDGAFLSGTHPQLDDRYVKECDDTIMDILMDSNRLYREKNMLTNIHIAGEQITLALLCHGFMVRSMTAVKKGCWIQWPIRAPDWVAKVALVNGCATSGLGDFP